MIQSPEWVIILVSRFGTTIRWMKENLILNVMHLKVQIVLIVYHLFYGLGVITYILEVLVQNVKSFQGALN